MKEKPKIFCFSNVVGGGEGMAYALAEDGTVLGSHLCSHEIYVQYDLGVAEGYRPDRHDDYKSHYPNGYQMEFVPAHDVGCHEGISRAMKLNSAKRNPSS